MFNPLLEVLIIFFFLKKSDEFLYPIKMWINSFRILESFYSFSIYVGLWKVCTFVEIKIAFIRIPMITWKRLRWFLVVKTQQNEEMAPPRPIASALQAADDEEEERSDSFPITWILAIIFNVLFIICLFIALIYCIKRRKRSMCVWILFTWPDWTWSV